MPKAKLPKFSRPGVLRKLKPSSLLERLSPYRAYLASRHFDLPDSPDVPLDLEALGLVLGTPTIATPPMLCAELEMLEILAEQQCLLDFEDHHDALVKRLRTKGDSEGDIALKILRQEPDAAWETFDKRAIKVQRVMTSYRASKPLL